MQASTSSLASCDDALRIAASRRAMTTRLGVPELEMDASGSVGGRKAFRSRRGDASDAVARCEIRVDVRSRLRGLSGTPLLLFCEMRRLE